MIGFLKMIFCVQIPFFFFFFFGQSLESTMLMIIFPLHVKIYENCEMFKTIY